MKLTVMAGMAALAFLGFHVQASASLLGTADTFAVLAGSAVTNTGQTVLSGDLGVWPGGAITGFPPGIVTNGSIHAGDPVAMQAQADALTAYNVLAGEAINQNLTNQDLGGMTLYPGVYHFNSSAFLTGMLTLDAQGNPNARFDFQIGSTLITGINSSVRVIGGADARNVYWQVGSSATLDTGTKFTGHILAYSSVTANTGATLAGSALARNGAVTLDTNAISLSLLRTTVTGHVELEVYVGGPGIKGTLEYRTPGTKQAIFSSSIVLDSNGNYSDTTASPGVYDLACTFPNWLRQVVPGVTIGASGATANFSLTNGDAHEDNAVNLLDLGLILSDFFNTGTPPVEGDLNWDGHVGLTDLGVVLSNFMLRGDP